MKRDFSQFERDKISLREQALEEILEDSKKYTPVSIQTLANSNQLAHASHYTTALIRNKVDAIYPKSSVRGEVVVMGGNESLALGFGTELEHPKYEYEPDLLPRKKLDTRRNPAIQVAAGSIHSACLHRDGTVSTWGTNDEYALGRNKNGSDENIKPMEGVCDIIKISAGENHTLVLDIQGRVFSCGMYKDMDSGTFRELTSLTHDKSFYKSHHEKATQVLGLGRVMDIDAGKSFSAALDDKNVLYTWGMGNHGQLARSKGMGGKPDKNEKWYDAAKILSIGGKVDLTPFERQHQTYDLTKPFMQDKSVTDGSYKYDLDLVRTKFLTPKPVEWAGPKQKRQVLNFSCGDAHILVVARDYNSADFKVYSSGNSAYGQLGHGNTKDAHALTNIVALNGKQISKVAAGIFHSLALTVSGKQVYAWGKVDEGATGLFDESDTLKCEQTDYVAEPTLVAFPKDIGTSTKVDIVAGETFSFCLTDDGRVFSWGFNESSQTGHYNIPAQCTINGEEKTLKSGETDEWGNVYTGLIARPRLLDVMASVNELRYKSKNKTPPATKCMVKSVAAGSQHAIMVIERYL